MKSTITIMMVLLSILSICVKAQTTEESRVKILPTPDKNIVKVLYANEITNGLEVRFLYDGQTIDTDKIRGTYATGISKRYDVTRFKNKNFQIKVVSPEMTVTYTMTPAPNGKGFAPMLEQTTVNHLLVRKNN